MIGEQDHLRSRQAELLQDERLFGDVAFLDRLRVVQEGRFVEGVRADLIVGEAVAGFEKGPERSQTLRTDENRFSLHRVQRAQVLAVVGDQHARRLLKKGGDRHKRNIGAQKIDRVSAAAFDEVGFMQGKNDLRIGLRTAQPDFSVQPVLPVDPRLERLEKPAEFRLRSPSNLQNRLFRFGGAACYRKREGQAN